MSSPGESSDPVLLSALEHYSYCPRQCALIHVEQTFDESIHTLKGRMLHERVDLGHSDTEAGVRVTRSLPLWSDRLGLVGRADVVEFHGETPYPVEYKSGPKDIGPHASLQLCAQALCLEEMLGRRVPAGALYQHASRRRTEVVFTDALRAAVIVTIVAVREVVERGLLPAPVNDARCRLCSLRESCLPQVVGEPARLAALSRALFVVEDEEGGQE